MRRPTTNEFYQKKGRRGPTGEAGIEVHTRGGPAKLHKTSAASTDPEATQAQAIAARPVPKPTSTATLPTGAASE